MTWQIIILLLYLAGVVASLMATYKTNYWGKESSEFLAGLTIIVFWPIAFFLTWLIALSKNNGNTKN